MEMKQLDYRLVIFTNKLTLLSSLAICSLSWLLSLVWWVTFTSCCSFSTSLIRSLIFSSLIAISSRNLSVSSWLFCTKIGLQFSTSHSVIFLELKKVSYAFYPNISLFTNTKNLGWHGLISSSFDLMQIISLTLSRLTDFTLATSAAVLYLCTSMFFNSTCLNICCILSSFSPISTQVFK